MTTNENNTPANLSADELAAILTSYNDLAEKLQKSHDSLQREVRRLRDELEQKNRQLERRKRLAALGEMAAGLAHEIRNPLGGIRLYADILRRDLVEQDDSVQILDKILSGVRMMDSLVTEVLAMTHTVEPKKRWCNVVPAITNAIELLGEMIQQNHTHVSCSTPTEIRVWCDADMIHRAVLNVVRNAVEAAGVGGTVMVSVTKRRESVFVRISDSGPGVDPGIADSIFNPFYTTKSNGTGLGLAIVHRIIEAHDGSITLANSEAGGAMFTLKLPIGEMPQDAASESAA